jgi:hypothetical protein
MQSKAGLASSSTGRNVRPEGRDFGNFERVFDQLAEILGPKRGVFRPILPPKGTSPPPEAPWWAAGRNWPKPFHQLVEIFKGSLRALVESKQPQQCCPLKTPRLVL